MEAEPGRRSTGANTVVTERPVTTLTRFLNTAFNISITTSAEVREWLADGGWQQLEVWLHAHRNDRPRRVAAPPRERR